MITQFINLVQIQYIEATNIQTICLHYTKQIKLLTLSHIFPLLGPLIF